MAENEHKKVKESESAKGKEQALLKDMEKERSMRDLMKKSSKVQAY